MTRPSWPATWMQMAHVISQRSYDPRLKVGCVIVSNDNRRILGVGYNGNARGLPNAPDSGEPGQSGFVHAEVNAIINAQTNLYSANVYLTHSPCTTCAKALMNAGVWTITYGILYRDPSSLEFLERQGLIVSEHHEQGR